METYSFKGQALAFDQVLPYEGQVPPIVKEGEKYYLQIAAKDAEKVGCVMDDTEYVFEKQGDCWRLEYPMQVGFQCIQILIDDIELIHPLFPISYGYSRPYNYVAIPVEGDDFYAIKDVPHGSVRREYFFSNVTKEWESCMVYTPACYETDTDKTFPVLYLQHGHGENEIGWTASGRANFIMDNLIAEGKAEPFVIVMSNGMVQQVTEEGERIVNFHLFEEQLIQDIIPFAEKKFRIGGAKQLRAMAGLSMGSLQTCMIGFTHPELFSSLGVFSGFVSDMITGTFLDQAHTEPGDDAHMAILENAEKFAQTFDVFFRSMGWEDPFWEHFEKDDRILKEKQIKGIRRVYEGKHNWNVWRRSFYDFAQLIFKKESR